MRSYPQEVVLNDEIYRYEKILKEDFFSVNMLYKNEKGIRYVLKLSDFRFIFGWLLRPLAVFFSRREYRIYKHLTDISGIPELGPRYGLRGYFHRFIEGRTLYELPKTETLPENFFSEFKKIIDEIHKRRIFYLDLNKLGNIIVGKDNLPYLIDFQICMHFKRGKGIYGRINSYLFNLLINEDIYHLYKHKKRFQPHLMTEGELLLASRTKFNKFYNRILGQPYRRIKRLIYPSGSNEIIWYKWKKQKDKNKRMP